MRRLGYTIIGLLLLNMVGLAQNVSNRGRDFWVGYGHHQFMEQTSGGTNSQEMVLYLSAEQPAVVKVSVNGTTWTRTYNVPGNTVIVSDPIPKSGPEDARLYSLPPSFGGTGGEGIFTNKAIHIESNVPIVAYAHIYGSASSGASMLMPTETWGYTYTSVNSRQVYARDCYSWMYIIANKNGTKIKITPSVSTRNNRPAGVAFDVDLDSGQIYQVIGKNLTGTGSESQELTGTTVKSIANANGDCFPVAVFSGSSRTSNPASCGSGGGDNDNQQLFPQQAWGKRYLTAPLSGSNSASTFMTNSYKVVVKDPTTVVRRNGVVLTGLLVNSYYRFESNTADLIEADKPILVAQFMTGGGCLAGGLGDPEMMIISPIEQAIDRVGFYRNNREGISVNYLTLIVPNGGTGLSSLTIDGGGPATFSHSYTHPQLPNYTVVVRRWNAQPAQCLVKSDSGFTALTYGLGSVESYGYNAGTFINNLNVKSAIHNVLDSTTNRNDFTCIDAPIQISLFSLYRPTQIVWKLSQVTSLQPPSADTVMTNPVTNDSLLINGVWYYKYSLPRTYTFTATGTIQIPMTASHPSIDNCKNTEEFKLDFVVKPKPFADFTFSHPTGCTKDTVTFTARTNTIGAGFQPNKFEWIFPVNDTLRTNTVKKLFPAGPVAFTYRVITSEGCVDDSVGTINVQPVPTVQISANDSTVCAGSNIAFTATPNYTGSTAISSVTWNTNGGADSTIVGSNTISSVYPNFGNYTIKALTRISPLCVSDTATLVVKVFANPQLRFSYPIGCVAADGIVQFRDSSIVADTTTIASYTWNFGDANASPTNPNTSTVQNPTHTYSNFGTYTIQHGVTSSQGCRTDSSFQATFNLRPVLSITPTQPAVCVNAASSLIPPATVTNSVPGTIRYFKGPGTDSLGNFSPSLAGVGTHTIQYFFTSNAGCTDSIATTKQVFAKPTIGFVADTAVCTGGTVLFTDTSSVAGSTITNYQWQFGTSNVWESPASNTITKTFTQTQQISIRHSVVSAQGCVSDTISKPFTVRPLPVPNFSLPSFVCMPAGAASFTSNASVADGSILTYAWQFGDGGTDNVANPTHTYTSDTTVSVRLRVTSAFGCTKDSIQVLSRFFPQPVANFTVTPDTLCQGADNRFVDISTAPNSTIASRLWNFDDGTTDTIANPIKRFTIPREYTITLLVRNAVGCVGVPATKKVQLYLQPVIDAGPSFVVPFGSTLQVNPTANDSTTVNFQWTPSSLFSNANTLRPNLLAIQSGVYYLTATGLGGCTATDSITVIAQKQIEAPNAFSPNGDGINDTWLVKNLTDYPDGLVQVFNRYGQVVFESRGYSTPWNGKYNGKPLPVGTYYYVIDLKNGTLPIKGYVVLLQ